MIRTGIWTLDLDNYFDLTITNNEIPPSSPFHLTTDDAFFKQSVPGLKQFPNMNITVTTSLVNISSVDISAANGITIVNTINTVFNLVNDTFSHDGWTLLVDVGMVVSASVSMNGNNISVQLTPGDYQTGVQVVSSDVGPVSAKDLDYLVQLAVALIPALQPITIPTPSYFTVSSPFLIINDGYGDIGCSVQYSTAVPSVSCSATQVCPVDNTCCQWNGTWGCCTLPQASCCSPVGCCYQGTQCTDEGCQ